MEATMSIDFNRVFKGELRLTCPDYAQGEYIRYDRERRTFIGESGEDAAITYDDLDRADWEVYSTPPVEPQNCVFCGGPCEVSHSIASMYYVDCRRDGCYAGPDYETEQEAVEWHNRLVLKPKEDES
jgi:putative NADPH-quinone reductase